MVAQRAGNRWLAIACLAVAWSLGGIGMNQFVWDVQEKNNDNNESMIQLYTVQVPTLVVGIMCSNHWISICAMFDLPKLVILFIQHEPHLFMHYWFNQFHLLYIAHFLYTSVCCIDLALKAAQMVGKSFKRQVVWIPFRNWQDATSLVKLLLPRPPTFWGN